VRLVSGERRNIASPSTWEPIVGYSRAVVIGPHCWVAGTTAPGPDVATQTRGIFEKIGRALAEAGFGFADVVRTRIYVTDITKWRELAEVHREFLGHAMPASTMVEVKALADPSLLVEIDVDAYKA
jgi:enamine deaminase RidA (YjgF/YER057c/UK114 family)